jgi:hypothetical protein
MLKAAPESMTGGWEQEDIKIVSLTSPVPPEVSS